MSNLDKIALELLKAMLTGNFWCSSTDRPLVERAYELAKEFLKQGASKR